MVVTLRGAGTLTLPLSMDVKDVSCLPSHSRRHRAALLTVPSPRRVQLKFGVVHSHCSGSQRELRISHRTAGDRAVSLQAAHVVGPISFITLVPFSPFGSTDAHSRKKDKINSCTSSGCPKPNPTARRTQPPFEHRCAVNVRCLVVRHYSHPNGGSSTRSIRGNTPHLKLPQKNDGSYVRPVLGEG